MIVAVDPKRQKPPPEGFNTCDNFIWIPDEFDTTNLTYNPNCLRSEYYCQCLTQGEVVAVVVYSVVGFFLLAVIPIACCCRYCCKYHKLKKKKEGEHAPLINSNT